MASPTDQPTASGTSSATGARATTPADRAELEGLADHLLLALRPWATSGHAQFHLPGPASRAGRASDGLEAFARSFLAAAFRLSAAERDDHDHAGWYALGLINGTDPDHPEAWPRLETTGQARVEAAAVAIGLFETRRWIWDRLDSSAQGRIIDWLAACNTVDYPDNNWRWFCNVTAAFLRSVGGPCDERRVEQNIEAMEDWYLGDGWYTDGRPDGRSGNVDWYNGWVMHLFSLWYCRMSAGMPGVAGLQDRYRSRLREYLRSAGLLFGADGAPLFQGRSLVYRYATVAAGWAGAIFDADPLPAGTLRRLALRGVRYFTDRGAISVDGLLSLGWLDAYEEMRQPYSGPGSPYWSGLGLAGLVLGPEHPVWATPDAPLPVERSDVQDAIEPIGWLVAGTRSDGIVRVVNHGVDHSGAEPAPEDPLYCRLAYSTATAPIDLGRDVVADNQVALFGPAGQVSGRRPLSPMMIDGRVAASRWGPISCWSVVKDGIEIRVVRLSEPGGGGDLAGHRLIISGFPVPQHPVPGARTGLIAPVRCLLGAGREVRRVHDRENPFGASIVINRVVFDDLEPGRAYAVSVGLHDRHLDHSGGETLPELTQAADGAVMISWPDRTVDQV